MKKLFAVLFAISVMPILSIGSTDNNREVKTQKEEVKAPNNGDEWMLIGTTEIVTKVGQNAGSTQTVQVYENHDGKRAIKDKRGYQEFWKNSMYQRYPDSECFECRYQYQVMYNGRTCYTNAIIRR